MKAKYSNFWFEMKLNVLLNIVEVFKILLRELFREQIKINREKSDEFAMNSNDTCIRIDEKLDGIKKLEVQHGNELRHAAQKASGE